MSNFKIFDPVEALIAAGPGGGGGGLPATGGILTGNLTMQQPAKVVQCEPPVGPCDLTNKAYVDSLIGGGPFLPLLGGTMAGEIFQPLAPSIGTALTNKAYVDSLIGGGPFLPLLGGTMAGEIFQPLAPSIGTALANKAYVDAQAVPDATALIKGKVQLSGDLGGVGSSAASPIITSGAITNAKLANLSGVSQLKGSSSASPAATDISLGTGLSMTGSTLDVNPAAVPSIPVLVSQGGTGATTLTGYLKGNGTSPITSFATVPTTDLSGQFVGSVNGVAPVPTNGGNATVLIGNVTTGTLAARPVVPGPNGDIYIASGDPTPSNNGRTYISDGTNWQEVTTNQAATDARYVLKAGDTMTGELFQPIAPSTGNALANRAYVDAQIVTGSTPDATTSVKGKIQLAGDLGGVGTTAATPVISNLAITNPKVNPGLPNTLKGTNSLTNVDDIIIGSGLSLTAGAGPTLSVNSATLPKAGAAQFGAVEFDVSGDLEETAPNSGIGVVKPLAITNPKVNPGGASTLKGTNSLSAVDDIIIGSGLSLTSGSGPTLSVNSTTLPKAGATQFGVVEFDSSGDLVETDANSGIGLVKPLAITNSKLDNLSGVSQLKGSSSSSVAATDITLGPSMSMVGSQLNSSISIFSGINPNITAPTDRPATSNIQYIGTNGSLWVWNGITYISNSVLGVQQYVRVTANIPADVPLPNTTPIPELTIPLAAGQRARIKYVMRCSTTSGSDTLNFVFPNWTSSIISTISSYTCQRSAADGNVPYVYGWDMTSLVGNSTTVRSWPEWNGPTISPRCWIIEGEIFNNGGSSINWTINAVVSNLLKSQTVLAESSLVYTYFSV